MGSSGSILSHRRISKNYSELINRETSVPLFLGLPPDTACRILFEWLNSWNTVARLDVALCSPKQLADIVADFSYDTINMIPRIKSTQEMSYIDWATSRRLKVNHLRLEPCASMLARLNTLQGISSNLRSLWLFGRFEGSGWPSFIQSFNQSLTDLQLHNCALGPQFHSAITSCPHLLQLTLMSCSGTWCMGDGGYPKLQQLRIFGTPWLVIWSNTCGMPLPNLRLLHLGGLAVNDDNDAQVVLAAGNGGKLSVLALEQFQGAEQVLHRLARRNPFIGSLYLAKSHIAATSSLYNVFFWCRSVHTLSLSHMCDYPSTDLMYIAELCGATVTNLNVSFSKFHPPEEFKAALCRFTMLKVLDLSGHQFEEAVEFALPQRLVGLRELKCQSLHSTDRTIDKIATCAQELQVLNMSCPPRVMSDMFTSVPRYTAAGVQMALENLPELRELAIDLPVQREWVTAYPRVRILQLLPRKV